MTLTRRQCLWAFAVTAPASSLSDEWSRIAKSTNGVVGAAALHLTTGQRVSLNGDERFPLASVCKLPIAMNILALVDDGKLALDQEIEVLPGDVVREVSDIAERWPAQRRFPLNEMIELMVAHSDNTAVETVFRIGGGAPAMAARFRQWKVDGVRVDRSERQCGNDRHRDPKAFLKDPRDTGTPNGTVHLLAGLFRGEVLSKSSTQRLVEIMKSTTTFPTRLKGLLPPGTIVAHKTGTINVSTNDSGVIFLPSGGQLAISVYVKESTQPDAEKDRVIARIARAAFDYFG
ncbi:MAG: class A beta-lactamase [Bryobacteraceae bacterium]|jgi:beta-lactamase class A